jgi:hypothetical protein
MNDLIESSRTTATEYMDMASQKESELELELKRAKELKARLKGRIGKQ